MSNRYVTSTITRQTTAVSKAGFGTVLILGTTKALAYKEYAAASAVADITTDYGAGSKEAKLATAIMAQNPRPSKIATLGVLFNETTGNASDLVTALNTLIKSHNDFYFLTCASQTDAVITALAGWTNTQDKLYFASTSNKTLSTTVNSLNTALLVHPTPADFPAGAWVGVLAPFEPGTYTATFKTLNGISISAYDSGEVDAIHAANGNTYIKEGGVNITSNGKTTSGEYIDIIQSQHYMNARITENVFGLLVRMPKVPFDFAGVALTVAEVEAAIKGAPVGMIARDEAGNLMYYVKGPDVATISANDKANRLLPGIEWGFTLAGAVEDVDVRGVMSV